MLGLAPFANNRFPFITIPYLAVMPFGGALGAYLSRRMNGSVVQRVLSALFPVLTLAAIFVVRIAYGLFLESKPYTLPHFLDGLSVTFQFAVVAGPLLVLGAWPFCRPISRLPSSAALVLLVISAACSSDHNVTGPTDLNRQYRGILAGGEPNESASFDLTVAANSTGTLKLVGGQPMAVAGTYVAATQLVTVSGGGFTLTGTTDDTGQLQGTYTHGSNSGYVAGFEHTAANPVTTFCGTYAGAAEGVFNFARRGASLSGAYVNIDGSDGYMSGTISGNSISITYIQDSPGGSAVGTLSGTTMSGTWTTSGSGGTWTANTTC